MQIKSYYGDDMSLGFNFRICYCRPYDCGDFKSWFFRFFKNTGTQKTTNFKVDFYFLRICGICPRVWIITR